jgi:hypothetical protein
MTQQTFELLAGAKSKPLFQTEQAYQDFRERFQKEVKPELDRQREARRQSEEDAKKHLVY